MVKPGSPAAHVAKAHRALKAARFLASEGFHEQSASDAYYAAFHVAQALLASAGLEAETHSGVHTLLARHFARVGPLPALLPRALSHLMADRLLADYGVDRQMEREGAAEALASAIGMMRDMLAVLADRAPEAAEAIAALRVELDGDAGGGAPTR